MRPLRFALLALGSLVLFAGLFLAAFCLALGEPVWPYHWLRHVYLVKDRLAADTPGPRCLILGGSSAWFGLRADQIEQATGWHTVNLGIHAEVPLEFELWQADRHLRRGDTVILADELVHYRARPHRYTTYAATEVMLMAPRYWWESGLGEKLELLTTIPPARVATGLASWLARGTAAYADSLALPSTERLMENLHAEWAGTYPGKLPQHYNYLELDRHGDMTRVRQSAAHDHDDYSLAEPYPESVEPWRELTAYARRFKARGVRCLSTWPPFERHEGFDLNSPVAQADLADLRARLEAAGWTVVGEPGDAYLGSDQFYDTPYHLTTEAAGRRTERFIGRLKALGLVGR